MAIWDKISSRGNVQDRRGLSSGLALGGGGLGLGGIILLLLLNYYGGGDLTDVLNQLPNVETVNQQQVNPAEFEGADNYEVFVSKVLGSNNDMWDEIFTKNNLDYEEPELVLFRAATQSGCGGASSAVGPHYCPNDETIYLDETFFDELQIRFKAKGGDVAEAYVISHEVGHHVQNLLGQLDNSFQGNKESIATELQADCFAGLWAHYVNSLGVFEPNEVNEAIDAAAAVGDDRIQTSIEGRVTPENWTHGSSEQRVMWFNRGYTSGNPADCNTHT